MRSFSRLVAAAFVIGRRDFTATVFSKAFLLFLIGPLFPLLVGVLFGSVGAKIAVDAERSTVAIIASQADFAPLARAREDIAAATRGTPIVHLQRSNPQADRAAQTGELLRSSDPPIVGVLSDLSTTPRLSGAFAEGDPLPDQVRLILAQARAGPPPELLLSRSGPSVGDAARTRGAVAQIGQGLLFILTLLLAGMLLSQLIEEKSNKVIEVLAAAVPVDAIFLGKLFAMLCVSLLGIAVWASVAIAGVMLFAPSGALSGLAPPALGWPAFVILSVVYFAFGYLLMGAAFLGIGAQASTVREVQTLSMPVTMAQVFVFAFAATAVTDMDGPRGIAAAVFPLSSPFAMLARAAEDGSWWPHVVAILWQTLWVALILRVASRIFRRSVLKSGPVRRRWWRRNRQAEVHSA